MNDKRFAKDFDPHTRVVPNCKYYSAIGRIQDLQKALEFLVEVKAHKSVYGKDEWYMDAMPMAWEQARRALADLKEAN